MMIRNLLSSFNGAVSTGRKMKEGCDNRCKNEKHSDGDLESARFQTERRSFGIFGFPAVNGED